MLDVEAAHLEIVKRILRKHVPGAKVMAFGSRVTGTAAAYSDLDLAIKTERGLDFSVVGNMRMDFEESSLPFRVDILDWSAISPEFRKTIEARCETISPP
jgi:predicted nucleotidyltransferase